MKALITGINGFAGSFLAEALVKKQWKVAGTVQPGTNSKNLSHHQISLFSVDLLGKNRVVEVFKRFSPDVVFHLAGVSSVKESFDNPQKYFTVNLLGSLNLLEAIKEFSPSSTVVLVSSGEIYGEGFHSGEPVGEESPLLPKSPYAVSKAALDLLGRVYAQASGLKVIIARPLSHTGPGQTEAFFVPAVAKQIARIIRGLQEPRIYLGDLNIHRDFTDVRDVVEAYILLSQKGKSGEAYNICSGRRYLLKDLVDALIKLSGADIAVEVDPDRLRKIDLHDMRMDNSKITGQIGWAPWISMEQTLKDTFDYWASLSRAGLSVESA